MDSGVLCLGATRSHLSLFKRHRAARIDHYVIEVNKLIIRLEKVCGTSVCAHDVFTILLRKSHNKKVCVDVTLTQSDL